MAVRFCLLGSIEASVDGEPVDLGPVRQRSVLAALLADANRSVSADQLIERVWGTRAPQRAPGTLYSYISRLRRALADAGDAVRLSRQSGAYVLAVEETAVDLFLFRRLLARARREDDDGRAAEVFEQALGLWRGEAFATADTPWFNTLRESSHREKRTAEWDLTDVQLRLGRHTELLAGLFDRVRAHPLDERLASQLMLALYRSGRAADALAHYEDVRHGLAEELGIDPGPALRRVHEQILTEDVALAVRVPPPAVDPADQHVPIPRQLPASPAIFSGRDAQVEVLCEALVRADRHTPVAAVDGVAGVGKSALAVHVGHRVEEHFPDGQLYVNLRGAAAGATSLTAHQVLVRWLPQLGVPGAEVPADAETASALWRSVLTGRRLLLVFDDAVSAAQIRPLLPAGRGCAVLVTSRTVLSTLDGAEHVHLEPLTESEAVALLARMVGADRVAGDPVAATDVVGFCERLPLLLRIVAARLAARPAWPVRAIADRLAREHQRLNELQAGELSVRASLAVSLREAGEGGERVFPLLAVVGAAELDLPLAASLADLPWAEAERLLEQLVDARLVDSPAPGYYQLHDVVRLYAREQAHQQAGTADPDAAPRRALHHYLALAGEASRLLDPEEWTNLGMGAPIAHPAGCTLADRPEASSWIDFAAPHLPSVMAELTGRPELHADITRCVLAVYPALAVRDRWQELIKLNTIAVRTARDSDQRALEARSHNLLGMAYGQTGRMDESLAEFRCASELWEALDDRHQLARASNNLGILARLRGDLLEAVRCHERGIRLFQEAGDDNGRARALTNLGVVHQRLGNHAEAISAHECAIEIFRAQNDQYRLGQTMGDLAKAARLAGRYGESIERYEESLRVVRRIGSRLNEAEQLWGLAHSLYDLGERDAARTRWRAALDILRDCGELTDAEAQRLLADPVPEPPAAIRRNQ
ncbi:BTAD domain-containing putative transcriptional regulator [Streptomyces sp. NPDC001027]|uniref:AfsR/SARP family transcriptional regulator n=1 Tax=Streptomyces sp. NPDC001027 TaxID=3154771 RepID=UPI003329284C